MNIRLLAVAILLAGVMGCSPSPSSSTNLNTVPSDTSTHPFAFHKLAYGTRFTMNWLQHSDGSVIESDTFRMRVDDTNAVQFGHPGATWIGGYYNDLFISYSANGDIHVFGNVNQMGRNEWMWYPLSAATGHKVETIHRDTLMTTFKPNDTPDTEIDTVVVLGTDTLMVGSQRVGCIESELTEYHSQTFPDGSHTRDTTVINNWYAPSLGFWVKQIVTGNQWDMIWQMLDYTP